MPPRSGAVSRSNSTPTYTANCSWGVANSRNWLRCKQAAFSLKQPRKRAIAQRRLIEAAALNQQFSMAFPDDILIDLGLDSLLLNMNFGRSLVVYVRYDHQQKAGLTIPSYISFVIHDGAPITVMPLGRAAEIDAVAATFTQAAADKDRTRAAPPRPCTRLSWPRS